MEFNGATVPDRRERAQGGHRLFNDLIGKSQRITRFYYYSMLGNAGFDSGLRSYRTGQLRAVFSDYKAKTCPACP